MKEPKRMVKDAYFMKEARRRNKKKKKKKKGRGEKIYERLIGRQG